MASALTRAGGNIILLKEMVRVFLMELPLLMTNLCEGVTTGDANAIEGAARKLKGSVGNSRLGPPSRRLRGWKIGEGAAACRTRSQPIWSWKGKSSVSNRRWPVLGELLVRS
jgi:hypothetical protein